MEGLSEPSSLYRLSHFKECFKGHYFVEGDMQPLSTGSPAARNPELMESTTDLVGLSLAFSQHNISITLDLHSHLHQLQDDRVGVKYPFTKETTGRCPKRSVTF